MAFQTLPGFRDFYPEDYAVKQFIISRWREVCQRYGFVEYDGPVLEPLELYTQKSGEEIVRQLFNFTDKGGREVALRPELTPTLARMAAARERQYKKPMKWFSTSQCFRYERTQKGRLREFFQLNCDVMGEGSFAAEVEILALLVDLLREFGLTDRDFQVRFFSRDFWRLFLTSTDLSVEPDKIPAVLALIDKIERLEGEALNKALAETGLVPAQFERIRDLCTHGWMTSALQDTRAQDDMTRLRDQYLQKLGDMGSVGRFIKLDGCIVRGLAYYTSTTFETFELAQNAEGGFTGRALAGGGRYDDLIEKVGGVKLPAIGFGMGDVVLGDLLRERNLLPANLNALQVYVVIVDESLRGAALGVVSDLRRAGYRTDYSLAAAKVGKQFQAAEERGAKCAVVIAPEEWVAGNVKLKNLSTREEIPLAKEQMVTWLQSKL
ncbi:MAG: histidine--tRNA ligase [Verrucomicrobiae bacterium]|nr:histidine--tRNA ligase [Verrucomicrobiae bacterium]